MSEDDWIKFAELENIDDMGDFDEYYLDATLDFVERHYFIKRLRIIGEKETCVHCVQLTQG